MKRSDRAAIEELARLLDGDVPAATADASLRELATLAATVTGAEDVPRPTPAFRAALRHRLLVEVAAAPVGVVDRVREAAWQRTARLRNSFRVGVATAVASGMLGTAGVAVAAQQALPGELLYGVKRATESVRLAVAGELTDRARVHLALARERLDEVREGTGALEADEVIDALAAMDDDSVAGADAFLQAVEDGADAALLDELTDFTAGQRTGLAAAYAGLPASARPFADRSFEVLRRIDVQVAVATERCGVCEDEATGGQRRDAFEPVPFVRLPGDGPAVAERPTCDCVAPDPAPAVRDPGLPTAPDADADADPEPQPQPDREPDVPDEGDRPGIVPPLPGPLAPIGEAVDDAIGDLVDSVEVPLPPTGPDDPDDEPTDEPSGSESLPDVEVDLDDVSGLL